MSTGVTMMSSHGSREHNPTCRKETVEHNRKPVLTLVQAMVDHPCPMHTMFTGP